MAESVIGLYKTECVRHEGPWRGADDLEPATLNWVWWFNQTRIHSQLGYVTPIEHEAAYYAQEHPLLAEPTLRSTRDAFPRGSPPKVRSLGVTRSPPGRPRGGQASQVSGDEPSGCGPRRYRGLMSGMSMRLGR